MHFLEATGKWQILFFLKFNFKTITITLIWKHAIYMPESVHFYSHTGQGFSLLAAMNQSFYLCVRLKTQYCYN